VHAPLDPLLRTQWRPLASLADDAAAWRELAARVLEPNVFYEPSFALAAAPVFAQDAGALLVSSAAGRLLGLFPMRIERRRYGFPPAMLVGFVHAYAPLGTPLVDRDHADAVFDAFFNHLERDEAMPPLLLLPLLPEHGLFSSAFERALSRRALRRARFGRHRRAQLIPGAERAHYIEQAVSPKLRKELNRKRRRLAEMGEVRHQTMTEPAAMTKASGYFLDLEAGGWKGRAGTAAANDPRIRAFLQNALAGLSAEGKARGDVLSVDARPVAASIVLRSGAIAWNWKIAYDENYARFSPGVQLTLDLTDSFLADESIARIDSCATADHPMIDHLWRERLALCDHLIGLARAGAPVFVLACGLEWARRALIFTAKRIRDLIQHQR
jgi:CelD/BcsL family acetyltransferase involved in cellulose biosynthesis